MVVLNICEVVLSKFYMVEMKNRKGYRITEDVHCDKRFTLLFVLKYCLCLWKYYSEFCWAFWFHELQTSTRTFKEVYLNWVLWENASLSWNNHWYTFNCTPANYLFPVCAMIFYSCKFYSNNLLFHLNCEWYMQLKRSWLCDI